VDQTDQQGRHRGGVIAVLAVPWAFPAVTTAVVMTIGKVIPPLSLPLIVLLAVEATLVLFAAIWWRPEPPIRDETL
jgi:hypothetical protein